MPSNIGRKQRNEAAAQSHSKDSYVNSFQILHGRPHADKALPLLQKVASLVKPIMRSHGWRLPLLSEFFPSNPSLVGLNVNGGQQILLRLRPHWAPNTFYSDEDIVGVMLHELTHNVHGPHDDKFYKYLSGLEQEYEELQRNGYAGESFFGPGKRVGEGLSHNVPITEAKRRALEAAERRAKAIGGGANRLGGKGWTISSLMKTPGQLAAEAAERRLKDEKACGRGQQAEAEADQAARKGARHAAADLPDVGPNTIIVIDSDSDSESEAELIPTTNITNQSTSATKREALDMATVPNSKRQKLRETDNHAEGPGRTLSPMSATSLSLSAVVAGSRDPSVSPPGTTVSPPPAPAGQVSDPEHELMEWTCATCTYENHPQRVTCEMCSSNRPPRVRAISTRPNAGRPPIPKTAPKATNSHDLNQEAAQNSWDCLVCGERSMPHEFWTCRFCGQVKLSS